MTTYNKFAFAASDLPGTWTSDFTALKFTVPNNWQVQFTDIEGKPKKYNAQFSCIKGGRILWLQDAVFTGSGFTGFGKKE